MNKESSDEKLLKLIEGGAEARRLPQVGIKVKAPARPRQPFKFNFKFRLSIANLNKGLFIIGVVLTVIFVYRSLAGEKAADAELFLRVDDDSGASRKTRLKEEPGNLPLQEYLAALEKRNMFLPAGAAIKPEETAEQATVTAAQIEDMAKDLKLVGVIWSSAPEALVEDQTDKRTYLVKKGDTVGQKQFKVKEVRRNSAVLEIEIAGKIREYELR